LQGSSVGDEGPVEFGNAEVARFIRLIHLSGKASLEAEARPHDEEAGLQPSASPARESVDKRLLPCLVFAGTETFFVEPSPALRSRCDGKTCMPGDLAVKGGVK
jgi:hypothetical protein